MKATAKRRWMIAAAATLCVAGALPVLVWLMSNTLQDRTAELRVGMLRTEVHKLLGPPALTLPKRAKGTGDGSVWVDQFWNLDVNFNGDGRVISFNCRPADSPFRRAESWFRSLFL